jgi:hypothetical protein
MTRTWASSTLPLTCVVIVDLYAEETVLRSSSKSSRNLIVSLTETATVNKEMYIDILRLLRDAVRTKRPEEKRSAGFSFTTMLQHTGWFWLRISYQRTTWQHWSIPHNLLTCLHLIFICSLLKLAPKGRCFSMLLTSLRMRRKSWKDFHKTASRNVSNTFTFAGRNVYLHKETIWKEIQIK